MARSYNHPNAHALKGRKGYEPMNVVDFIAPLNAEAKTCNNGAGAEAGLPAGSVVHLDTSGATTEFKAGCTASSGMPMFLVNNAWDSSSWTSFTTQDGNQVTAVQGIGGSTIDNGSEYYSNWTVNGGEASLIQTTWSANGVATVTTKSQTANHTAWTACNSMEMSSTEFYVLNGVADFVPGTALTSPAATTTPTTSEATNAAAHFQELRGGYLTPAVSGDPICGYVSRGLLTGPEGVKELYFWPAFGATK